MSSSTTKLTERYEKAFVYASRLHATQVRKGNNVPYITHLMSVSSLVLEHGGTEDEAIAGLLHDAVEDQGGLSTGEEIRQLFGEQVYEIVLGCTDATTKPKPPWQQRKEAYIAHLSTASKSILRVSLADKIHNARSILADFRVLGDEVWERFQGKREGTLWYYRALVEAFRAIEDNHLEMVEELERIVSEMEGLAEE